MPLNGVMVIDKPQAWTSHDVVARLRNIFHERSIGHLGTLDPMATGVLPLVIGKMTRISQFYENAEKIYEGTIRFGFATDTYDAEGDPAGPVLEAQVSLEELKSAAAGFVGVLQQVPPPFSAKKIKGVPAYKLARKKQDVNLKPVEVEVREFVITGATGSSCGFRCRVSSGTYIRSIAHELGQKLGIGSHLSSLRRTQVAEFTLADAHTVTGLSAGAADMFGPVGLDNTEVLASVSRNRMDKFDTEAATSVSDDRWGQFLFHPRRLLPTIPSVTADDETVGRIRHGRTVNLADFSRAPWVKVFAGQSDLICLARRVAGSLFHPKVVLLD